MIRALAIVTLLCACGGGGSGSTPATSPTPSTPPPPVPPPSNEPTPLNEPNASTPPAPTPQPSTPPQPQPTPQPSTPPAPAVRAHNGHAHCGWIGADTAEAGVASFMAHADWFDAIHPKWFTLNSDGTPRTIAFTDDARVISTAHAHAVKLIPLVDADSGDYVLAAAQNPAAHAQALLQLVTQHGYDGIELDYEHLWSLSDRAPFSALIQAVATAMHQNGKVLTLALPALWHDSSDNGYDYAALQQNADTLHLMGYDYHWLGGPHLGPIAPKGWIDNVGAYVQSLGAPQKYDLGVANYGIGSGWYTTGADAAAQC